MAAVNLLKTDWKTTWRTWTTKKLTLSSEVHQVTNK